MCKSRWIFAQEGSRIIWIAHFHERTGRVLRFLPLILFLFLLSIYMFKQTNQRQKKKKWHSLALAAWHQICEPTSAFFPLGRTSPSEACGIKRRLVSHRISPPRFSLATSMFSCSEVGRTVLSMPGLPAYAFKSLCAQRGCFRHSGCVEICR